MSSTGRVTKIRLGIAASIATACFAGCGGPSSSTPASAAPPAATYTIGGAIAGLTGSGLVLRLNGTGNLPVNPNATAFTFIAQLASGAAYSASVFTQPTGPSQTCTVTNGSGTVGSANVAGISVSCTTNSFTIGGTVSGLFGTGLVLQNNGGNDLAIGANGAFTFTTAILSGATYAVTVLTQPSGPVQSCVATGGSGTVGSGNVTSVGVNCNDTFTIGSLADPLATQQWHLKNTGPPQNAFADGTGVVGMDINVEPVYSTFGFTGNGVIAAVVDTGMEVAHEDLAANVIAGGSWNFLNGTPDPTNTATNGDHGTSVAGLIAMARNPVGGIGVAPSAKLKGFNFLLSSQVDSIFIDSLGGSTASPKSDDVFIFNQSFGLSPATDISIDPAHEGQYASGTTSLRGGKGALYVKAAGNGFFGFADSLSSTNAQADCSRANAVGLSCENANFDPENTVPYQVVAGAMNANGIKASYSTAGSAIWVSAPGGEFGRNATHGGFAGTVDVQPAMVTTDQMGCTKGFSTTTAENGSAFDDGAAPNTACNYWNGMNGTSSATPVTAGVIALMLEANPLLTWRDVKHVLASTARQIDATRAAVNVSLTGGSYVAEPAWTTNHATPQAFKFHNWYGFGLVDASAAVNMARTFTANQFGAFANTGVISSGALNIAIPDNSVAGASSTLTVPVNPVHVIETVQISVSATHQNSGDLGIELLSPLGTRSVLKNIRDGFTGSTDLSGMVLLSNAFYGENPAGVWMIKVVDGAAVNTGTLTGWTIRVYGH
jgi:subtilisin family serine protease/subtilisin-like proprotein convertase family protein